MDTYGTKTSVSLAGKQRSIFDLQQLKHKGHDLDRLPYCMKVLLENILRNEDGRKVTQKDVQAVLDWNPVAEPTAEIQFTPSRVLLQDFTGVPCVVDLASMRDAMASLGGDPNKINPLQPVELVIDHSVQVDAYGSEAALQINLDLEFQRNGERYAFLKWGQQAFDNFKVVPPNTGICHQVNLEHLARVVFDGAPQDPSSAFVDTLVGTDSHTTMVNGLGVLGWGVGGIEAEAAMLGQPIPMLLPQVVGFELVGRLPEGATATDLVLTVTEMLRKHGVVGKFVEFFGDGIGQLSLADRATIANMAPEYGATCGIFPVDGETLNYLRLTGRSDDHVALVEAYCKHQGLWRTDGMRTADYSSTLRLDLSLVEPSVAGPKRPQDRFILSKARDSYYAAFPDSRPGSDLAGGGTAVLERVATNRLTHGSIVIAAITSCTNTSNPSVMVAAGLVAQKAHRLGLKPKPWVKTSLAPGSRVVTEYLKKSGLLSDLEAVGFDVVGYGCTTCIGNSGPLPEEVGRVVAENELTVVSVLSGNRNFEGRVNQVVKANYLMSPPLVVAYSFAGTIDIDLANDAIAQTPDGKDVFLRDIWPDQNEVSEAISKCIDRDMFVHAYGSVFEGDEKWQAVQVTPGSRYSWEPDSTYVRQGPYFEDLAREAPQKVAPLEGLRVLAMLGDSVTTDHISPAGSIKAESPAGKFLEGKGVRPHLFNSYGSRRGNHEVMIRGTFANVRLRNMLAPGTEGGVTRTEPGGPVTSIFEAAEAFAAQGTGLVVIAGKEYGTGSSRDWAAKGTLLLGVRAVVAESFERIHRSNLIGMGVLPLQFKEGENAASLGLTGWETYTIVDFPELLANGFAGGKTVRVKAGDTEFEAIVRLDTPTEAEYYRHGGVLPYVLRQLLN